MARPAVNWSASPRSAFSFSIVRIVVPRFGCCSCRRPFPLFFRERHGTASQGISALAGDQSSLEGFVVLRLEDLEEAVERVLQRHGILGLAKKRASWDREYWGDENWMVSRARAIRLIRQNLILGWGDLDQTPISTGSRRTGARAGLNRTSGCAPSTSTSFLTGPRSTTVPSFAPSRPARRGSAT